MASGKIRNKRMKRDGTVEGKRKKPVGSDLLVGLILSTSRFILPKLMSVRTSMKEAIKILLCNCQTIFNVFLKYIPINNIRISIYLERILIHSSDIPRLLLILFLNKQRGPSLRLNFRLISPCRERLRFFL